MAKLCIDESLRRFGEVKPGLSKWKSSKLDLVQAATEWEIPFPKEVSWKFLRQSVFDGWTSKAIQNASKALLAYECARVGMPIYKPKATLVEQIIHFIQNNGVGVDMGDFDLKTET